MTPFYLSLETSQCCVVTHQSSGSSPGLQGLNPLPLGHFLPSSSTHCSFKIPEERMVQFSHLTSPKAVSLFCWCGYRTRYTV